MTMQADFKWILAKNFEDPLRKKQSEETEGEKSGEKSSRQVRKD